MRFRLFSAAALSLTLILAACQEPAGIAPFSAPSFAQSTPIQLDVAIIEVIDEYQPPMKSPNVDQFFAVTPAEAVRSWARDRLRNVGGTRTLQVVIKDASVVQKNLPTAKGMQGAFRDDQAERYDARLEVELRIYGTGAMSEANISTVATRSLSVSEKASLADRERAFQTILNDLMASINAELEKNIYQYFGQYISYAPVQ